MFGGMRLSQFRILRVALSIRLLRFYAPDLYRHTLAGRTCPSVAVPEYMPWIQQALCEAWSMTQTANGIICVSCDLNAGAYRVLLKHLLDSDGLAKVEFSDLDIQAGKNMQRFATYIQHLRTCFGCVA